MPGSIERVRTTLVVKGFTDPAELVEVEVTNPKNTVAIEGCTNANIIVKLDTEGAHFRDKDPSEQKFAAMDINRCENTTVTFSSVRATVSLNGCKKVTVVCLDSVHTLELSKCDGCKVQLEGKQEATLKTEFLSENCNDINVYMPYTDKYGENVREFKLPTRIKTTFASDTKMNHAVSSE